MTFFASVDLVEPLVECWLFVLFIQMESKAVLFFRCILSAFDRILLKRSGMIQLDDLIRYNGTMVAVYSISKTVRSAIGF